MPDLILPEEHDQRPWQERLEQWIFDNKGTLVVLLVGLILLGFGLFLSRSGVFEGTKVEILEGGQTRLAADSDPRQGQIIVEIAGAVQNPGVYELLASDRVERLLIVAGGLAADANREWVEKNLNRAAKIIDGQKIYIPYVGEAAVAPVSGAEVSGVASSMININTGTASELDSLWGIGPARAQSIIESRPYSSVEELLAKKVIPSNVYERIKDKVAP
ncbi:hypothetical protein CMO96_04560 [Candidatus Woesebacteria bacterium]|nr:hypothetical protein [Candidatus Woesebacteria bacterium]|tara:strand:- start:78 stop:731 length:654 start_codon:yes stop_codon:yes gene_type:complete